MTPAVRSFIGLNSLALRPRPGNSTPRSNSSILARAIGGLLSSLLHGSHVTRKCASNRTVVGLAHSDVRVNSSIPVAISLVSSIQTTPWTPTVLLRAGAAAVCFSILEGSSGARRSAIEGVPHHARVGVAAAVLEQQAAPGRNCRRRESQVRP